MQAAERLVQLGRFVYRRIPFLSVRQTCFRTFAAAVRNRHTVVDRDGMRFALDLGETIDLGIYVGEFEQDIARAIQRFCLPDSIALDIGANIGAHTLLLGRAVGPNGRVYAFEPTEFAYSKLHRNVALNSFPISTLKLALGDETQVQRNVEFRASWPSDGTYRLEKPDQVNFIRLDDWCAQQAVDRVDFIKLDVDGAEFAVLHGGVETLRRSLPRIVMELGSWHFEDASKNPLALLGDLGYRFWDTMTMAPYRDVREVQSRVPQAHSPKVRTSINILAATALQASAERT